MKTGQATAKSGDHDGDMVHLIPQPSPSLSQPSSPANIETPNSHSNSPSADANQKFRLLLLGIMVLQNSSVVLVGRHTRASVPKEKLYEVNHLILITEIIKLVISCILEQYTTGKLISSMQYHMISRPLDFLRILVPALLYLVQNSLLYVALSNLSAPLFQVTYQSKLLTTALVSVLMLNRRYSFQQWICLTALAIGVSVVVLGESKAPQEQDHNQNLTVGLLSVTFACFSSAFAGVYFEKVLKKQPHNSGQPAPSLWIRNIQLAFFSTLIALAQTPTTSKPFCFGFNFYVWVVVLLQAGGGLLVAAVIKYADNVLKGLATSVAVVVSTVGSMVLFDTSLTMRFCVGSGLILSSVYVFSNPVAIGGKEKEAKTLPR